MKTFKKSLAVLTTAAILASSATIVAYAAYPTDAITIPEEVVLTVDGSKKTGSVAWADVGGGNFTLTLAEGKEGTIKVTSSTTDETLVKIENNETAEVTVTVGSKGNFEGNETLTIEYVAPGISPITPGAAVVWVNGKDVKASKDGKTPAVLYKTYKYDVTGQYSGGKWMVCVTDPTAESGKIADEAALIADLNANKGKLSKAATSAGKLLATAKIKDGVVTVTAGKAKTDDVANVWVYEVKKGANKDKPKDNAVVKTETIAPMKKEVTVLVANASPIIKDDKGAAIKGNKLELADKATQVVYIAPKDDKKGTPSKTNTYSIVADKCKGDAKAEIDKTDPTKVTVTSAGDKSTIVLKCDQSGKTFKISVAAPKASKTEAKEIKVTFDDKVKDVKVKSGDAAAAAATSGTTVVKKDDVITFALADSITDASKATVKVNDTTVTATENTYSYTVKGDETAVAITVTVTE